MYIVLQKVHRSLVAQNSCYRDLIDIYLAVLSLNVSREWLSVVSSAVPVYTSYDMHPSALTFAYGSDEDSEC